MTATAVAPEPIAALPAPAIATSLCVLAVDSLRESSLNPRRRYYDKTIGELADSMRAHGVLTPLLARPFAGQQSVYELAAGHRRVRAAKQAGLKVVPVLVREMNDREFLEVLTIENLQREDVHPLDEALGYQALLEKAGYDVKALAAKVGKSETYVYQRLKLATLIPEVQKLFVDEKITVTHATLIARLSANDQKRAINKRNNGGDGGLFDWNGRVLPVADVQHWIEREIYLDLNSAPFKKDDAALVPDVGACPTCEKRSGFAPALFPELAKRDVCLDGACFQRKIDAHLARKTAELQAEHPDLVQIKRGWSNGKPKAGEPLMEGQFHEVKKGTAGAKPAIVVDGHDRGAVKWITTEKPKTRDRNPDVERWQQQEAKRAKAAKQRGALRRLQFAAISEKLPSALDLKWARFLVTFLIEEVHQDTCREVCKALALDVEKEKNTFGFYAKRLEKAVTTLDVAGCTQLALQLLLGADLATGPYDASKADRLIEAAKLTKVDLSKIKLPPEKVAAKKKASAKKAKRT
jgi:ParB family chromosome partitioning protein